jgi:hypothetical protein
LIRNATTAAQGEIDAAKSNKVVALRVPSRLRNGDVGDERVVSGIASISDPVMIAVRLIRVRVDGAVVAGISRMVLISVALVGIVDRGTIVLGVEDAVAVGIMAKTREQRPAGPAQIIAKQDPALFRRPRGGDIAVEDLTIAPAQPS